ncbi:MAG: hypothetical protein KDG89_05640 [Geminicoccaceae bacterium]|nr:hypothetical protein [Geminicoccaceae bacterium]
MKSLVPLGLAATATALQVLRLADDRCARAAWSRLRDAPKAEPARFDPRMVLNLPDPARRYFLHSIAPGTPLRRVAEIETVGAIGLGTKEKPNYLPMRASQILAAPHGFVWRVQAELGMMRLSGFDAYAEGRGQTRFWLLNTVPVARAGGGADFARSAAARGIAEALFWTPAALLPGPGIAWEPASADTARLRVDHLGERFAVDLTVAGDGRPRSLVLQRWSRENRERAWRFQPFGGTVEATGGVDGYRVATRVEGGNHFGTKDYFPFYRASVTKLTFY